MDRGPSERPRAGIRLRIGRSAVRQSRGGPTPDARAKVQARITRLTRTAIIVASGATAFIGITVAKEHPGGSAPSTAPRSPAPTPAPTTGSPTAPTPTTSPPTTTTTLPAPTTGSPTAPTTTTSPTPTTSPPTTTTTKPVATSGGTSKSRP